MRKHESSWAHVVSLGLLRRHQRRSVPGERLRRLGLEDLEKRLVLSWPSAPLTAGDFDSTVYVNLDGDATIDAHAVDFDGDVDGYQVFFDESGGLTFETNGSTDTMVAFYDGPGAPDLEDDDSGSSLNGRISTGISYWSLLTLAVKGWGSTTGPYTFHVDGPAANSSAISIDGLRHGSATGRINDDYDYDFFQFTTSAAGDWTVTVDPDTSWDPMLLVFDTAGNPVGGSFTSAIDSGGNGANEAWTGTDLSAGQTYFIRVDGFGSSTGDFTLEVQGDSGDPNDQISEAYATALGDTVTGFRISPGEDVDMFEFTVSPGDIVSFDIDRPSGSSLDSWIRLFNGSGTQLAYNDDGAAPGESSGLGSYLEHTFASGGTYYLGVSGYRNNAYDPISGTGDVSGDTGEYTLTLKEIEPDPNDQISEAHAVTVGGDPATEYYISPEDDVDMFEFTVAAGQRVGFDVDRPLGVFLDSWIRLFNGSGTQLAYNDDGTGPGELISLGASYLEHTFASGGTYYLGVSGYRNRDYDPITGTGDVSGDTGEYSLTLTDRSWNDSNDQISEAESISVGGEATGSVNHPEDVDLWGFTVSAGQVVAFDVDRPLLSSLDSWIRLFDGSGTQLAYNDDGAAPGESTGYTSYLEYTFASGGTYYLGISGYRNNNYSATTGAGDVAGSTGDYSIDFKDLTPNNDTNDQISEAASISVGSSADYGIDPDDDVDMFEFTVTAGQSLGFDIDRRSSTLDSWIRLFDAGGTQLDQNDDGAAPGESSGQESYLEYTFAGAGTYYLGVSGYRNNTYDPLTGRGDAPGSTGDYTVSLTDVGASADINDQISEAASIAVGGSTTNYSIGADDDVDMFEFTVSAGQTIAFDIDRRASSSLDSWIRLFNAGGTQLAYNDDAAAPGEASGAESYLEYTFASGGTYYLGVSGYRNNAYNAVTGTGDVAGSTGEYVLHLTDLTAAADDAYENNDSKNIVDGRSAGGANSPNLGRLTGRAQIAGLAMQDAADWFKFRTDRVGTAADVVRVEFDHSAGDLDMVVYRSNGTAVVGSSTSSRDYEEVSLSGEAAGTFYVRVYGYRGATNPNYSLTIDPPTATGTGPQNYAVLFSGGADRHNNHYRYYLNVRNMYNTLVSDLSLPRDHIYVLFADGNNPAIDLSNGNNSDLSYAAGSHVMAATRTNLQSALATMSQTLDNDDHFLLYTYDHGGGSTNRPGTRGEENLTGWGPGIGDETLATWLQAINAGYTTYMFAQCFSGGMLDNLLPLGNNQFGCVSANHYESGYSSNTTGFAQAFQTALDSGLRSTHEVYSYALTNTPRATQGEGPDGTWVSGVQHPWSQGQDFPIFYTGSGGSRSRGAPDNDDSGQSDAIPYVVSLDANPTSPIAVGTHVTLTATASDPSPGGTITKVLFYDDVNGDGIAEDGEVIAIDSNGADGWTATWDTKSAAVGTASLLAVCENSALQRSAPAQLIVTLTSSANRPPTIDTFVPTPAFVCPVGQNLNLVVTACDPDGCASVTKVAFYEDENGDGIGAPSELIGIDSNGSDGWQINWDTKLHAAGGVTLLAIAEDNLGLRGDPHALPMMLATPGDAAPAISGFSVDPRSPITAGQVVTLAATGNDPDAGDAIAKMTFYIDLNDSHTVDAGDPIVGTDSDPSDGWTVDWDTKDSGTGTVQLLAVAEDSGLHASGAAEISVELIELPINHAPTVGTLAPDDATPMAGQEVVLTATASEPDTGDTIVRVRFFEDLNGDGVGSMGEPDQELLGEDTNGADGWSFQWDTTGHSGGATALLAVAYDTSNAASQPRSTTATFTTLPNTIGILDSAAANWYLRNSNSSGAPDFAFAFGPPNWTPVTGDWNNDDVDTAGIFDATMGAWYLRDSNSGGAPDYAIGFGFPGTIPVTGDWNNDGTDTIGLYHPAGGSWYLRDSLSGGASDHAIGFGFPGTIPVVGDWDGDGTDTIGLYHPAGGSWYLRDSLSGGAPDHAIGFGFPGTIPVTGDWNGDGTDTIGLYHSDGGSWYLRDSLSGGAPDYAIGFGFPGVTPITGNWSAPLLAAEPAAPGAEAAPLTDADLTPVVEEAMARWTSTGVDTSVLSGVDVVVADLSGNQLGLASGNHVVIDVDAAGHGWFVDRTPSDDSEFHSGSRLSTLDSRLQMDLLTAVMHEFGHVLGYDHEDHGVMQEELSPGIRRVWDELGDSWDDDLYFGV